MKLDLTKNGVGGLDVGELKDCTWYYIYIIGSSCDCLTYERTCIASSNSECPQLPVGYDIYRKIGNHFYFTKCNINEVDFANWEDFANLSPMHNTDKFWAIKASESYNIEEK